LPRIPVAPKVGASVCSGPDDLASRPEHPPVPPQDEATIASLSGVFAAAVRQFTDPIKIHVRKIHVRKIHVRSAKLRTPLLREPRPGILATNAQQKIAAEECQ
jgi:hypothetical protein